MRTFFLYRHIDVSGVTGTGVVAEGVEFTDGSVAIHWVAGEHRSTAVWGGIADVEAVHGHDGASTIQWTTPAG
ncbi:hypothetical protein GPOL_c50160 [Gordonia polyisoprenivorans VH2]|uniref:Uncharacterized protein n=2 Tax=Gordonia polyisoprenivorans TaxID=84595 RepID=H6N331_GORPV|nr:MULTISPECIES: hypothetical protein [Gordonia]AFA76010.1 hypothetical protein GPOL_c50160 [Gordonia polyisoprenivorans VH2]MBE7195108.1 hypothetical protein [Gordonia polyisoprenivorans]MDF3284574.1 hypothetical protein [Gordonia sp. N1V]NKY04247.1 hypothetical protein [Gordonia polyisoprenivorans]OPX08387.1 hypothetical protein B1964_26670 [Gordonia sp. i37]